MATTEAQINPVASELQQLDMQGQLNVSKFKSKACSPGPQTFTTN